MQKDQSQRPHRRRRRWVVKPRYQAFFALVLVLFQVDVGLIYQAVMQYHVRALAGQSGDMRTFLSHDLWLDGLPTMLLISVVMGALVYLLGLRFSHQIVGPLPRLSKVLRAMADGDFSQRFKFRPGDALEELAEDVNHLAASLEQNYGSRRPVAAPLAAEPQSAESVDRVPIATR